MSIARRNLPRIWRNVDESEARRHDAELRRSLSLYLGPGAVRHTREQLAYDGYDLVGAIGGFLGLTLGASAMSLYDWIATRFACK